jgi:hypothetical protein
MIEALSEDENLPEGTFEFFTCSLCLWDSFFGRNVIIPRGGGSCVSIGEILSRCGLRWIWEI